VKLVLEEPCHEELRADLARWDGYLSSQLLGVEAIRACARYGAAYAGEARDWLLGVTLLPLDETTTLAPTSLRSLDAIHLATALTVRDEIGAFFAYDGRLCDAAAAHGLPVAQPGA
jgi:predicted nucleic acid-binding protein